MDPLRSQFAGDVLAQIEEELSEDMRREDCLLTYCGQDNTTLLLSAVRKQCQNYREALAGLCSLSHKYMKEARHEPSRCLMWRRLYTGAALVWSLLDILPEGKIDELQEDKYWENVVERLDKTIIIAGAPGENRLDLVREIIQQVQNAFLPRRASPLDPIILPVSQGKSIRGHELLPSASLPVPVLSSPSSIAAFRATRSHAPFILRQFASGWPAVRERRWASKEYLQDVAGRGRVVPVEIGRDYRSDDWAQRIMSWDEFLDYLFSDAEADQDLNNDHKKRSEVMYLAQHDIFKQFPTLREDIIVPDYVYACLPPPEYYPQYRPPSNDEELVINTWIGPEGTVSPAHTDPFYNFYTQVVGRKTVWLAPPSISHVLRPYTSASDDNRGTSAPPSHSDRLPPSECNSDNEMESDSILSNTSRLDVFASASDLRREVEFTKEVVPVAMSAVLDEGDMLFFPPGWWHAFRSESTSFSVSIWF